LFACSYQHYKKDAKSIIVEGGAVFVFLRERHYEKCLIKRHRMVVSLK